MGFSDKIILFDSFNEPLDAFTNNIPTLSAVANIKLASNQNYTFARVYVQVCGGSLTGLAYRVEFNGKTLGSRTWAAFENDCKFLDIPVTDLMKDGKNTLKIHLDGRLSTQEVNVYADLLYSLNTEEGPDSVETTDPEKESVFGQVTPIIITGVVIIGVIAVVVALINRSAPAKALKLITR